MTLPVDEPRRKRNPLVWGVFVAMGAIMGAYRFRDVPDVFWAGSAIVFLVLYFLRSRFAWHALTVNLMVAAPLYMFLAPSWRLQLGLHPGIIWFPVVYMCVAVSYDVWSRRRYLSYLSRSEGQDASEVYNEKRD